MTGSIDDIRNSLEKGLFRNEVSVCDNIVRRMLADLGWPQFQPDIVIRKYEVSETSVDFALCDSPLKPLVFIEAKQVGNIEGAEQQFFQCAFQENVPIAVLTDGQRWRFFHPTGEGDYNEYRICELDLIRDNSDEILKHLNRYLNYERICDGEVVKAIKADYHVLEAWNSLLQEADEFLLDVVRKKVKSLYGDRPSNERVLDFLKNLNSKSPLIGVDSIAPSPKKQSRAVLTRLIVVMPNGEVVSHRNASDTFREVIFKLGPETVLRVDKNNAVISTEPKTNTHPFHGYHITTGHRTARKKRLVERIAKDLGVELKVEIVEK